MIYLIGSLRNPYIPIIANALRHAGHEVFDDWFAAGPEADDKWQEYETGRGHTFPQALDGIAANHVFNHDRKWLDHCDTGVLVMPAGKSVHLEFGYMMGQGKRGVVLMDKPPERYDVMYRFATLGVVFGLEELVATLQ